MKIDKKLPLPTRSSYPFEAMKVGDSFLVEPTKNKRYKANARSAAYVYQRKHNKKFATRDTGKGVRVWRTA